MYGVLGRDIWYLVLQWKKEMFRARMRRGMSRMIEEIIGVHRRRRGNDMSITVFRPYLEYTHKRYDEYLVGYRLTL